MTEKFVNLIYSFLISGPSTSTASLTLCSLHANSENTENIDEIVQDHDNFGTDENDDDSSLDSTSMSLGLSLLVAKGDQTPIEEILTIPAHKMGGFKRKSNEDHIGQLDHMDQRSGMISDQSFLTAKKKRETFISEEQEVCLSVAPSIVSSETEISASNSTTSGTEVVPTQPHVDPPNNLDSWLDSFSTWTHAQRLLAIDQLIGRCHPTQVRHMMSVIEPQFQRDFISLLPKGMLLSVNSILFSSHWD